MKTRLVSLVLLALCCSAFAEPTTRNNDDSCDISALPAATLLLPYFEVDLSSRNGEDTLFTVTNVTRLPQIARVTLWTDYAYPVFSFSIFLTGYDAQSISLYDVIANGVVARTTSLTGEGGRSAENDDNALLNVATCVNPATTIPAEVATKIRNALTTGAIDACPALSVGAVHPRAIGYVTVDVVNRCAATLPTDAGYFTDELLYDNVLIGDYQQINRSEHFAQGGTMVHIRAVPEGGTRGSKSTDLERTFYSRFQNGGTADRRQPLPSTFAARWISGGTGALNTTYKIWREGVTGVDAGCGVHPNASNGVVESVRFDQEENPVTYAPDVLHIPIPPALALPSVARIDSADTAYLPPNPGFDVAGWMYFNLDGEKPASLANQNWVIVSMAAEGRYSVDFDAMALGNGCSPAVPVTAEGRDTPAIGPAPNVVAAEAQTAPATINNDDSCDIGLYPAATLLLPYFEVDLSSQSGETTIFTVTNVTRLPQIARVTVWTDRSYPILHFFIYLTGYDVQAISLYDVLANGHIAPPIGTSTGRFIGERSVSNNPLLNVDACDEIPVVLPGELLAKTKAAVTTGLIAGCEGFRVGNIQPDGHARGYVTVDVVRDCNASLGPSERDYFTQALLFDNVLIGDYQQVNSKQNSAQGNTMVHIRAIPEGGTAGHKTTQLARTFYSRMQDGGTADRRQPLPSTFAAHWVSGGPTVFDTTFKIWRDGVTRIGAGCGVQLNAINLLTEFVRFDQDENPVTSMAGPICPFPFSCAPPPLPSASEVNAADASIFPANPGDDLSGWMYMNLDNEEPVNGTEAAQGWVIQSMSAEGIFSVDFDAVALGNGCSPPVPITGEDGSEPAIGPAANQNP